MSLQSDFEYCLEYAELLEAKKAQQAQAQNNIIFIQNESSRLKNKLKICTVLSVLSAVAILAFVFIMIGAPNANSLEFLPFLIVCAVVFGVSLFNRIKTKKESDEVEYKKPSCLQQYIREAEVCEREMVNLVQEIYQEDLFDIVPVNYFSVVAIEFCLNQIRKKMANSAAEAFRQLDAEIKRLEQMEYLEQMNNAKMEQLNDIKRAIEINTLITLAEQEKKNS